MRVKIHHEGANELTVTAIIMAVVMVVLWFVLRELPWLFAIITGVMVVMYLLLVNFYR